MTRRSARVSISIASILVLLLVAMTALPTTAASPTRRTGAEETTFRLVNCIRTGGYVTRSGTCKARGSGKYSKYVKPLKRSRTISREVSWPWARKSVQFYGTRSCWIGHSRNGSTVDKRFASASLRHVANGENMGCGFYGGAQDTVLRIVRMWQAEKSYRGSHWRQIKDADFKSVGVGVAKYGSRKAQLVVNFYGKVVD
jgi:hypothetical protein